MQLPSRAYQTYQILAPPDLLVKTACSQAGCLAWRHGWQSIVDESTPLGRAQAHYIRNDARRTFRENRTGDGHTVFTFESGQRCFAEHKTRPEIYRVRGGDFRANTGLIHQHTRPVDWVDDFATNQQRLAVVRERG